MGTRNRAAFYKLIWSRIQDDAADVFILNFDSILMVEMTFATEVFTWLAMQRFPGKTVLLEGLNLDSRQNIEAALRQHPTQALAMPLYEKGRITFIGHLQPHLQEFWEQIQGETSLQAPALAQRLGKSTGRVNDNLRAFHRLGVLRMQIIDGIKTYFPLSLLDSAESEESGLCFDSSRTDVANKPIIDDSMTSAEPVELSEAIADAQVPVETPGDSEPPSAGSVESAEGKSVTSEKMAKRSVSPKRAPRPHFFTKLRKYDTTVCIQYGPNSLSIAKSLGAALRRADHASQSAEPSEGLQTEALTSAE